MKTKIYKYHIDIDYTSGCLLTETEAQEFLNETIARLKEEWLFKITGYIQ